MRRDSAEVPAGDVVDEVELDPASARVYAEGWQSWSPASWHPAAAASGSGPMPEHEWQHLMRFRPGTPVDPHGLQGEGLLVVDPGDGEPARCYGAPDPVTVPTIRATLEGGTLVVRSSGTVLLSEHPGGGEAALTAYATTLAESAEAVRRTPAESAEVVRLNDPPTVWCSWYRYFERVTADDVDENLRAFNDHDLPVDVVLIDDGWSPGLGEGLRPAERFGDLPALVDGIRADGRRAGLWLAPFLVGADTTLAREHPEWMVGPAGTNWRQQLRGLDLTHPGVRDLLAEALHRLVALGVDYLKLDFLYGGAVVGPRHQDVDPVTAYRSGLAWLREVVGPEVHLVGSGAPLLPSVGLVDAMRVSPDTFHEGHEGGSAGLRGLVPLAARAWQQGRLWVNDPDCVVARPSYPQREPWARAAARFGGLRSFSDRLGELDPWGLETVRGLLADGGRSVPLDPDEVAAAARIAQDEAVRLASQAAR